MATSSTRTTSPTPGLDQRRLSAAVGSPAPGWLVHLVQDLFRSPPLVVEILDGSDSQGVVPRQPVDSRDHDHVAGLEHLPKLRPCRSTHVLARDHVRVDPVVSEAVVVIILGCAGQPSWRRGQTRPSSHTGQCLTPSSGNSSLGPGVNRRSRS